MREVIFNAQTEEETIIETPDMESEPTVHEPTTEERLQAIEDVLLTLLG